MQQIGPRRLPSFNPNFLQDLARCPGVQAEPRSSLAGGGTRDSSREEI